MTTPTRALLYVRVSTAEQAASGLGLESQESVLRAEAERRGWEVVAVLRDEGASGKDLTRAALQQALKALADGEADVLAVAKIDRLTRSLPHLCDLLEWAGRHRVALVALDLGLDMTTGTGQLVAQIMGAVAQWERGRISERTREAAAVSREQGKQWGGLTAVSSTSPEVAQRIAAERTTGATWQSIADGLNADGVPTVRGGTQWRVSSVQTAAGYRRPPSKPKRAPLPEPSRRRRTA